MEDLQEQLRLVQEQLAHQQQQVVLHQQQNQVLQQQLQQQAVVPGEGELMQQEEPAVPVAPAVPIEVAVAGAVAAALAAAGVGVPAPEAGGKSNARMPTFSKKPGEDFLIFIGRWEAWAELANLNERRKKLSLFQALEGDAAIIARIFSPGNDVFEINDFAAYRTELRGIFASRADSEQAKNEFETRVQLPGENCQTFGAIKLSRYMVAYPDAIDRAHLVREFIRGIKDERIQERLVLAGSLNYNENVHQASNHEAGYAYLESMKKGKVQRPVDKMPSVTPSAAGNEEPMELGSLGEAIAAIVRRQRDAFGRYNNGDGCFGCGSKDHWRRECPNPRGRGNNGNRGRGWGRGRSRGRGNQGRAGRPKPKDGLNAMQNEVEDLQELVHDLVDEKDMKDTTTTTKKDFC